MVDRNTYKIILIVVALMCFSVNSSAQYSSKEELKEVADKMFKEKDYVGSLKLFSQLLSTYPKDPNYNYKYGACVLFGKRDKDGALQYLKYAVTKSNVDPIAFYFLGRGYHHDYEFSKAIENYNKFKEKSSSKEQKKYSVDREIEMCQNGEELLKSMADIGVLSKKEIKESDFYRSYKLDGIGGKIIVKPEQFKTKLDKKHEDRSIVYLGQAKDMIVFSSYGKDGSNGKDIYKSVKKSNGDWGEAVLFSSNINSPQDEDYPFLHPDGKTLYFSSKGYTSMGGYDVFKSTFNEHTREWSSPENLDFPINTPDDDILYISDMENKFAYFASSRASIQGELTVYNVTVESVPFVHSVIYGFFVAESNPEMKSATITVKAVDKDRKYGVHTTKSETGEYLLMFPTNGGKFKILVETTEDAPVHSAVIEIPPLEGFRALKQELRLVGEGDNEKLIVKNLFDESDEFDINDPLVVQNILKERAKMEVNLTEGEVDSIAAITKADEIVAGDNLSNSLGTALADKLNGSAYKEYSDEELAVKTDETAERIIAQAKISKIKSITSYRIAEEKSVEAKVLYGESEELFTESESAGSEPEKNEKIVLAERKKLDATKLINEMVAALAIAKTLDNEVVERMSDLAKVKSLQKSINTNLENKERKLAETDLKELDEIAGASYHNESALDTETKIIDDKLLVEEKKYGDLNEYVIDLQDREIELTASIKTLENKKGLTKKKKEIEVIDEQIKSLAIDVEDTQFDLENAKRKAKKGKEPYLKAKNEAAITKSVIAMLNGENKGEEEVTDPEKIQLENDIAYFEKEGLVGLYSNEDGSPVLSESKNTYDLKEHKGEFKIIDDEGEIVSYNKNYSTQLIDDVKNVGDSKKKEQIVIHIYESWINDIDDEISIREQQLAAEENPEKKENYKIIISSLQALKLEKEKEKYNYTQTDTEEITVVEEELAELGTEEEELLAKETIEEVIEEPGNYAAKHTTALASFSGEDTYESSTLKATVHENWAKDIEEEITLKKADLSIAKAGDKNNIENEIAVLENDLLEQEEFASLYALQAESLQPETPEEVEPVVAEEIAVVEEGLADPVIAEVIEEEEPLAKEIIEEVTEEPGNYREEHTAALANFSGEDTYESSTLKATVHENWAKDIEEEIALKKANLSIASGSDKNKIENEIAVLENDLLEQEEFSSLYALQAESLQSETPEEVEPVVVEEVAVVEEEIIDPVTEEVIEEEKSLAKETIEEITEEPGNYTVKHTAALANFSGEDTYESSTLKAAVHENWAKDIEEEIALKKADLSITSGSDKNKIENEIAVLESDLLEQEEFSSLYALQAESLQPETLEGVESVVTEELTESVTAEVIKEEEPLAKETTEEVGEEPSISESEELLPKNLTENNLNGAEDDFSNLKYNNKFNYKSPQSKIALASVASLKKEARDFKDEADVKLNEANNTADEIGKNRLTLEAEVLYEKGQRKQESVAKVYEGANRSEYYNNQSIVSGLKKDNTINPINITIAELMVDEANNYYDEAKLKRNEVVNAPDFSAKERLFQQAYELEMKAIEAQKRAILKLGGEDVYSTVADNGSEVMNDENGNVNNEVAENGSKKLAVNEQLKDVEELTLSDKEIISELKGTEIEAVKKTGDYQKYAKLKNKKRRLVKEAEVEYVKAAVLEADINDQKALVASLNSVDETAESAAQKVTREDQVKEIETVIAENEAQILALRKSAQEKENQASKVNEQTAAILIETDESTAKKYTVIERAETFDSEYIAEIMRKTVEPNVIEEPVAKNSQPILANIDVIPSVLKESIFVINNNKAAYSNSKRIPVSPKLPEGLVFKVQIGAFRNPIPQSHFKGFAPIMAENAGKGITRYTAGLFKVFNMANEAKGSIRSIGYSDAYVVAFFNGKRINMTRAREIQNGGNVDGGSLADNTTGGSISNTSNNGTRNTNLSNENSGTTSKIATKDIRNIEGTFFTIQIGVYSKEATQGQLNNVTALNSERTASGLIRYTSGVFKSLTDANIAKEKIRENGMPEAFVVSYSSGKRVNMAKAIETLSGGNATNNSTIGSAVLTEEVNDGISKDVRNVKGIFFTVQVGVYSNQITNGQLNNVTPLNSERTVSGLIRYTSGVFKTLDDANIAKEKIIENGISDAFIVAYNNGVKTTIANANEQLGLNNPVTPKETTVIEKPIEKVAPIIEEEIVEEKEDNEETVIIEEAIEEEENVKEEVIEDAIPVNEEVAKKLKIKFKIQLGAYENGVPVDEAGLFLKLSNRGIKNYEQDGKTIYIIGSFRDYVSATDLKTEMKEMGVKNPIVVAFQKSKEIDVNEALELIENN